MEQKVEKLVERVAQTIYADWGFGNWEGLMVAEKETWLKTARQIFSNEPDLALIVGKELPKYSYSWAMKNSKHSGDEYYKAQQDMLIWHKDSVILLADALKEEKG